MTNYTDIVHRALWGRAEPITAADLFRELDMIEDRATVTNAVSYLLKLGRVEVAGHKTVKGRAVRLYRAVVAPDHSLGDSASAEDLRAMAAEAEDRARAAELESRPLPRQGGPVAAPPVVYDGAGRVAFPPVANGAITAESPTPAPKVGMLRAHPALADLQRELDAMRGYFDSAASLGPRIQRGAELAAALKAGIPVFEDRLPRYTDAIRETVNLLEELAA